uniref:Uncharacterized protein n=1 Tax=Anguilla anguilla TaxID=7936 RepID=A0A0E9XGI8_ANGAN
MKTWTCTQYLLKASSWLSTRLFCCLSFITVALSSSPSFQYLMLYPTVL